MERLTLAFLFMIVLAGAVVGHYYWRLNERTQELAELRVLVSQAKTNLQTKETSTEVRRRSLAVANGIVTDYQALTEEKDGLAKQVAALEAQNADVQKRFIDAVSKVRKADFPQQDVVLKTGQVLAGATVQRMSDTEMTFQHSGGISRVDVKDLPPEVRDRYRQQMSPFTIEGGLKDPLTPPPAPKLKKK